MKDGSGDLNFGEADDETTEAGDDATEADDGATETGDNTTGMDDPATESDSGTTEVETETSQRESGSAEAVGSESGGEASAITTRSESAYPYFVRRSNVGDEREKRLEVHVREEVAEQEAAFRAELADELGVSEISKTDAREFALVAAFADPDTVAEQMREEGFGELE